jgi:hypothetical protein
MIKYCNSRVFSDILKLLVGKLKENSKIFNEDLYLPLYLPLWSYCIIESLTDCPCLDYFVTFSLIDLPVDFFKYFIQLCFVCCPSDSTVSKDAGTGPKDCRDFGIGAQML